MLVLGVLVLGVGSVVGGSFLFKRWNDARGRVAKAEEGVRKKEEAIAEQDRELKRIQTVSPHLKDWRKLSVPEVDARKKDPVESRDYMLGEYQQWLTDLANKSGIQDATVLRGKYDSKQTPQFAKDKPIYGVMTYTIEGRATLASLIKFFEGMHRAPLLHQVKAFDLVRPSATTDKTLKNEELKIKKLTVEVLQVTGAERLVLDPKSEEARKPEARKGLWPNYGDKTAPATLTANRNYEDMLGKNLFNLHPPKVSPDENIGKELPPPEKPKEKRDDVLKFVRLTAVDYTEGVVDPGEEVVGPAVKLPWVEAGSECMAFRSPAWEATLINLSRSGEDADGKAITWDTLRFRMTASNKKMRAPVWSEFKIYDKYGNTVVDGEVLRIESRSLLFHVGAKAYRIQLGQNMLDAMNTEVSESELKALGIAPPKEPEKPKEAEKPKETEKEPSKTEDKKEPSKTEDKKDKGPSKRPEKKDK